MHRPSHRELSGKLKQALDSVSKGKIAFVNADALYADLLELDFLIEDLQLVLPKLLREIRPGNYRGQRPPGKSYEEPILNCDLFAFRWTSNVFGCRMYLKFAIKMEYLWLVSLHRHREPKKGGADGLPE